MKLIRFGEKGKEKPGIWLKDGRKVSVSHMIQDYDMFFFRKGGIEKLRSCIKDTSHLTDIPDHVRLGAPISAPSKIICIGLNYISHANESKMPIPKEPVVFFKATSSICGPYDNLVIPKGGTKTDWEVELAVVIGKDASYVSETDAMEYVAGYMLHNDYSERVFQLEREGQWVKGKSCDTFAPLGPFLVTKDEIKDVHHLKIWLDVNGERKQTGSTNDFIFNIPQLVSYLSNFMTLIPGDIISTGTPSGVGLGANPQTFLKPNDIVKYGIEGLGIGKQKVVPYGINT